MKRIAPALVLASALALPAVAPSRAVAQVSSELRNPNILIDYVKPRKPGDPQVAGYAGLVTRYERYMRIYERVKARQVLEQFSQFMAPLRLPTTLRIKIQECFLRSPNAAYYPSYWTIEICYEWIDHTETSAPEVASPEGVTREEALIGGFLGVLLHETGHAVSDILSLPVLGREEDSADEIAAFVMLQFGREVARTAIKGTFHAWLVFSRQGETRNFWGQHSTPAQRYANFLCIGYGKEPDVFKDLAEQWLTPARRADCPEEYRQALNAFQKTILPHVDQELMRQVQATPMFRPGEGRW